MMEVSTRTFIERSAKLFVITKFKESFTLFNPTSFIMPRFKRTSHAKFILHDTEDTATIDYAV
jgi:hypothetical protein